MIVQTVFVCIIVATISGSAAGARLPDIYWNSSNPIFRIDNTDHIIDVNRGNVAYEYDQVNVVCPIYTKGTKEEDIETFIIYNVSKEEYDTCTVSNYATARTIAVCDKPFLNRYYTVTFRPFTPQPGGLEFRPGQDYYFVSLSTTPRSGPGKCQTHHMKVVFKVCCKSKPSSNHPQSAYSTARPPNNNNNRQSFDSTGNSSSKGVPEVSQTELKTKIVTNNNSGNGAQTIDTFTRINENPLSVNRPLIFNNNNEKPTLISSNIDKTVIITNDNNWEDNNNNNPRQYYSSTPESKRINSGSDIDSINTNKQNTINTVNNNNNFITNNVNNNENTNNNENLNSDNIIMHENSDKLVDMNIDHCPPALSRHLSWNWTLVGQSVNQSCPGGSQGLARWSCSYSNGKPFWTPLKPDLSDCSSLWVSHLEHRLNLKTEPIVSLADELAKGCREKTLFGGDLFRTTNIINHLVLRTEKVQYETHDDQQRKHVIREMLNSIQDIVSNLLEDKQLEAWSDLSSEYQKSIITTQINALERLALMLAEIKTQTNDFRRAHQNIFLSIHIRSVQSLNNGLHLPAIVDTIDNQPNGVTLHSNNIYLSPQTLKDQSSAFGVVKVIFVMYKKLGHLLKPKTENTVMLATDGGLQSLNVSRIINSDVFGIHLNTVRYTLLSKPIEFTLRHLFTENVTNAKCVYWDINRRDWSDQRCHTMGSNRTHTSCKCYHLTNFAILMELNSNEQLTDSEPLFRVIAVISFSILIIVIAIGFITLVSFRLFSNTGINDTWARIVRISRNLKPICLDTTPTKTIDTTTRVPIPTTTSLTGDHRTSIYVNHTNNTLGPKDLTNVNVFPIVNTTINCEPLINNSVAAAYDVNMGALTMAASAESPKLGRKTQKYYLTDDSSDYGCRRLAQSRCPKSSCRDLYSLHSSTHSPVPIEHVYECIDEDPYVAKLLLPAIQRSLDGQHARAVNDALRHLDNRPLISCSTTVKPQSK